MTVPGSTSREAAGLPPLLQSAISAHEAGQLELARPLYSDFLEKEPQHPTALQLFGLLHSQSGDYEAAIRLMQESLRLFPDQAEVANNLGNALSGAGRPKEAVDSYAQAIRLNPGYVDAFRNLGLCYLQLGIVEDARVCFERCVRLRPDDAAAWLGLGSACKRLNDLDRAISSFERALELRPDFAEAHHNLGVCLRMRHRPAEALRHYESARRLGLDRSELYHNLGAVQIDLLDARAAVASYRNAIRRNPEDLVSHRDLNKLLWEMEWLDDYLESYRQALAARPQSVALRIDYAAALNRQERFEEAERLLMEGLRASPGVSALKTQLAFTYEGQGEWKDSMQMHAAAVTLPDAAPDQRVSYVRALLACGRADEAVRQAEQAIVLTPFNQRAIAYLALCWRMVGDERDAILNDYERFVQAYDVPVPAAFRNSAEFNEQLNAVLQSLHLGKRHPPEQTLRGGTQTFGDLFDRSEQEIADLARGVTQCIREYISTLPSHASHPLLSRRRFDFGFAASWSVRLAPCGYHTMHVHPLGWISSAYYVQVPPEIRDTDAHGGGIKFGEPDIDLGAQGAARRLIRPAVGRLVLFPSYMWHGTVPFEAGGARTTVAFDVLPKA
jgi:tetratricopeptide (TPR) repeat protein